MKLAARPSGGARRALRSSDRLDRLNEMYLTPADLAVEWSRGRRRAPRDKFYEYEPVGVRGYC